MTASCSSWRTGSTRQQHAFDGSRGAVEFTPDLPHKRAAWTQLRMGGVVKVILRFREPFWEPLTPDDLVFLHVPNEPLATWWTTRAMQSAILTGWSGGGQTYSLRGLDAGGILDRALDALSHVSTLSRGEIEPALDASHVFDWRADEFSRGRLCLCSVWCRGGS